MREGCWARKVEENKAKDVSFLPSKKKESLSTQQSLAGRGEDEPGDGCDDTVSLLLKGEKVWRRRFRINICRESNNPKG